ncbi:MAG: flagellar biosynthesis protein [Pseudohongiellaceae bacterium]|jgi:flagellar biosynthesis protein
MSDNKSNSKKEKKAVALFYDGSNAPSVTAEGEGDIAEQIIALAREHNVPLFENASLLELLAEIGIGEEIPETLYLCIAQVIAFAYKIQGKVPEGWEDHTE